MKISLVVGSFYPAVVYGGPIYSTLNLCNKLAETGINIQVSSTNANGKNRLTVKANCLIKLKENLYVKYYGWANKNAFSIPMLFNIGKDIKNSDLVYLHGIFSTYVPITLLCAKIKGKPVLLAPHGSLRNWCLQSGSRFKKIWLKYIIGPFSDSLYWHVTSVDEMLELKTLYRDAKIYCIPNGIDIEKYSVIKKISFQDYVKKFSNEDRKDGTIIISMGRLHRVKGFDILIDAFNLVKNKFPEAILFIAGEDAGEKNNLIKHVKKLNLEKRVFFVGHLSGQEKIDFLANADIFALASHSENFGVVYGEALAAGTPVIASKHSPWKEVEKYDCGLWVDNSAEEFAKSIIKMFKENFKKKGANGRKFVAGNFSLAPIAYQFQDLFELIIKTKINT